MIVSLFFTNTDFGHSIDYEDYLKIIKSITENKSIEHKDFGLTQIGFSGEEKTCNYTEFFEKYKIVYPISNKEYDIIKAICKAFNS